MVPKVKAFIWSLPTVPHVHHFLPATSLISYVSIVRIRPGIRVVFCHEGYSNPCHLGRVIDPLFEGVCKNMIQGHVLSHSWQRSNPEQVSALETGCLKVYFHTTTFDMVDSARQIPGRCLRPNRPVCDVEIPSQEKLLSRVYYCFSQCLWSQVKEILKSKLVLVGLSSTIIKSM